MTDKEEETKEPSERTSSRLWTPGSEPVDRPAAAPGPAEPEGEKELSEEELRKRIEEAMEKITVADIVVDFMISLTSLAYQRMGIPHEVNEKFRDMDQAKMAIDSIDALLKALEGSVPGEIIEPLTSTLANLKLNFAKES